MNIDWFLSSDEYFHVARQRRSYGEQAKVPFHTHDFPEVFWVEDGEGVHRVGDEVSVLSKGDLAFIRPTDTHTIHPRKGHGLVYVNMAVRFEDLCEWGSRVFPDAPDFWGGDAPLPQMVRLSNAQLVELATAIDALLRSPRSRLMMEWILCELFRIADPMRQPDPDLPDWLETALRDIRLPENFIQGSTALAKVAGRSPEHVSRVTKAILGKTPSQIVNDERIRYAAHCLTMTDQDIHTISLECGFLSLGQFYRLFKDAYGMTPKRYRKHHRRIN